jgi:hypothetical protein
MWGKDINGPHAKSFASFNTEARLGESLRQDTYPMLIDEAADLSNEKKKNLVEMIKHAIQNEFSRGRFKSKHSWEDIGSLRTCIIVSNSAPPADSAYMRRFFSARFSEKEQLGKDEAKQFESWFNSTAVPRLRTLGDFSAKYVMSHQEILLGDPLRDWKDIAKEILLALYTEAGIEDGDRRRAWIHLDLPDYDEAIEENIEDMTLAIRAFILDKINQGYRTHKQARRLAENEIAPTPTRRKTGLCA